MEHLPNGKYPVKEVKIFGNNYIFILVNDLMVHTNAPNFGDWDVLNPKSINIIDGTITIYKRRTLLSSPNYQVVHTKEDIVEVLI